MHLGRILRKTGLTTSRSGELTLSDAEGTLKRRTLERQRDPLSTSMRHASPAGATTPNADDRTVSVTGPILTVNSVSNPSAVHRVDRSPARTVSAGGRQMTSPTTSGQLRTLPASERRYSFDDESQQFDWSATINLLSQYEDSQTSLRRRPDPVDARRSVRPEIIEPKIVPTQVEHCGKWEATLPSYGRPRSDSTERKNNDVWQSRPLPASTGQREYASDSEDSDARLERQRRRLHQRRPASATPSSSSVRARVFVSAPRTELEQRLINELRASQERLNYDRSLRGGGGVYSSCTLPSMLRGASNSFTERSETESTGRWYSTLPGKGRARDGGGGLQRATSELDFAAESITRRGGPSMYNDDTAFDRHHSLTSLRGGYNFAEQRLVKTTVSQRTGALVGLAYKYVTTSQ